MAITIARTSNPNTFKQALNKLGSDNAFRQQVLANPDTLTSQFPLSLQELHALRQAAILSGVDMTQINKVRADAIAQETGPRAVSAADIDISCCCCCCCGETSVVTNIPTVQRLV